MHVQRPVYSLTLLLEKKCNKGQELVEEDFRASLSMQPQEEFQNDLGLPLRRSNDLRVDPSSQYNKWNKPNVTNWAAKQKWRS